VVFILNKYQTENNQRTMRQKILPTKRALQNCITLAFHILYHISPAEGLNNYGIAIPSASVCTSYGTYSNGDIICYGTSTCYSLRACEVGQYFTNCAWTNRQILCEWCISCANGQRMVGCDGQTAVSSQRTCTDCYFGEYDDNPSGYSQSCTHCPLGKTTLQMRSTSANDCVSCGPGKYVPYQPIPCAMCPPGTYSGATGASACESCPKGTYSTSLGVTDSNACTTCPTGSYGQDKEATVCKTCAAGTFSNTVGTSACTLCPSGKFSITQGAVDLSVCTPCPNTVCQEGSYRSECAGSNSGVCVPCRNGITRQCQIGFYLTGCQGTSAGSCLQCGGSGFSSDPAIINDCLACPAGKYSPSTGLLSLLDCIDCLAGTFSAQVGALSSATCITCPAGTHSPNAGAVECIPCSPSLGQCPEGGGTSARCSSKGTNFACCGIDQYYRENVDSTCKTCTAIQDVEGNVSIPCSECTYGTIIHTGSPAIFTDIPNTRVYQFTSAGSLTLSWDMYAEILVVGGGGAGGSSVGGGGGAGTVIFDRTTLSGQIRHDITVGNGGIVPACFAHCLPACTATCRGSYNDITMKEGLPGQSSSIGTLYVASGGTGGGSMPYRSPKSDGGSGGGGGACGCAGGNVGPKSTFRGVSGLSTNSYVRANPGGRGSNDDTYGYFLDNKMAGAGGGGAGSSGQDFTRGSAWDPTTSTNQCSKTQSLSNCGNCGKGGSGLSGVTTEDGVFDFAKIFGTAYTSKAVSNFIAGGGAGGAYLQAAADATLPWPNPICLGGQGGGGNGRRGHRTSASDAGVPNTGSGGGGGGTYTLGGVGGSGLVLIKVSFVNCVCSPGTFHSDTQCTPCPTGTYGTGYGLTNQAQCLACAPGTYNSNTGKSSSSSCIQCAEGTYSKNGAAACDPWTMCPNGFYSDGSSKTNPGTCQECTN
jgi:hypothetical protein